MPAFPPAQNARNLFAIVDHMPLVTTLRVLLSTKLTRNATPHLQILNVRCIEGLSQVAREQIRDRKRMQTLEILMNGRNQTNTLVHVEAHFERLVMLEKSTFTRSVLLN